MSAFDLTLVKDLGLGAIAVVMLFMIARGLLVPRKTVDSIVKGKDESIEFWRHAAEQREKALAETLPLLEQSVKNHETVVHLVRGINSAVNKLGADTSKDPRR